MDIQVIKDKNKIVATNLIIDGTYLICICFKSETDCSNEKEILKFLKHSKNPNTEIKTNDNILFNLFATRKILPGESLSINKKDELFVRLFNL